MTLRAIIVDDEQLAREGVRLMLDEHDVDVVASCADATEAVHAIRNAAPDVVFLDIRMPGMTGFDVIDSIGPEAMPVVVFLTAYEEHAVRAFRANAADYLLKPIDAAALAQSIERVRDRLGRAVANENARLFSALMREIGRSDAAPAPFLGRGEKIALRESHRVRFLDPADIVRIAAAGDYVTIYTTRGEFLHRESMNAMHERLATYGFCRIHRSHIVNARRIDSMEQSNAGRSSVVLDDGRRLPLSRSGRRALIGALGRGEPDD